MQEEQRSRASSVRASSSKALLAATGHACVALLSPRHTNALEEEERLDASLGEGPLAALLSAGQHTQDAFFLSLSLFLVARLHALSPARATLLAARGLRASDPDAHLADHFAALEGLCPSDPFAKVELRVARAIVNLTGRFEADLVASKPVYRPRMADAGLPAFAYDRSRAELAALVRAWMAGPHWGEEEGAAGGGAVAAGPRLAPKVDGDSGAARRERYERDELAYETERGITRVRVAANFSNWGVIASLEEGVSAEDARAQNAQIVASILNQMSAIGHKFGLRFVFSDIDVSHTQASMRCVFNGEDWLGQTVFREREVEVLKLVGSNTSAKSLQNLNGAVRLQFLYLDGCPLAHSGGKTRANVFNQLTQHGPVPELRCLSLVGTSAHLASDWLSHVESKCPKLALVYFTRRPGDKALGWSDVVMMQSMREPSLMPCGHVGDASSLRLCRGLICPICRTPYELDRLVPLRATITQLTRVENAWKATIVDTLRNPLDDKVLYHECGELFNLASLHELYPECRVHAEIGSPLLERLRKEPCLRCAKPFEKLYVCYPRSAVEDDAEFSTLSAACGYFAHD